jgi:PAS domain S-box-containing protein
MTLSSAAHRYGLAVSICCAGVVLAWFSNEPTPLLAAVTATCIYADRWLGLLSIAICGFAFALLFLPPDAAFIEAKTYLRLAAFLAAALVVSLLIQHFRTADPLHRAEREARLIVENMPGFGWSSDPEGNFKYLSPSLLDYVRKSSEDFGRINGSDTFGWTQVVHPDDVDDAVKVRLQTLKTGELYESVLRVRRYDGTYRWFRTEARATRDSTGQVTSWYGTTIDIDDQKKAEEALRAIERNLRSIIESIPGMIVGADADGQHDYANQQMRDFVGVALDDALGQGWMLTVHPDERNAVLTEWLRCTANAIPMDVVRRVRRFDGVYRWVHARVQPTFGDHGRIDRWYGLLVDVDQQKKAEEALRKSEEQLSLIIDTIPALVWCATPDGRRSYTSNRTLSYLGMDRDNLAEPRFNMVHQDDAARVAHDWAHALEAGSSFSSIHRLRRADGEYRWHETRAEALRDEFGNVVRWYGVNVDVDDRQRAEEALRKSEQQLRLLIDTIPALVWCATPEGEPSYLNKRLMDYIGMTLESFDDPVEKSRQAVAMRTVIHPDDVPATQQIWLNAVRSGRTFVMRHRLRRADGVFRWVDGRGEPLRDDEGRIVQWYCVNVDIDDETRMQDTLRSIQEELARASQAASMAEISASIAHEINQPLAAVVTHSHACQRWLSADPPNVQRARITMDRIIRDANSAADVVRRIRALFKQDASNKTPLGINDVIGEVLQLVNDEVTTKAIRLETDLDAKQPRIVADRVQMQQLLVNLVRNGIDAMDSKAAGSRSLSIRSRLEGVGTVLVEVRDQGSGIEDPEKVFEPFFTTKENGMGMGLAICRSIVEAHDGRLWAAQNDHGGTTFAFSLPVHADEYQ